MTMLELAEACEKATADGQKQLIRQAANLVFAEWNGPEEFSVDRLSDPHLHVEACLTIGAFESAAMTLVPEGLGYVVGEGRCVENEPLSGALITPSKAKPFDLENPPVAVGEAATGPLALCAAALRARNEQVTK